MWRRIQPAPGTVTMETLVMDDGSRVVQVTPEVRVHNNRQPAVYTPTHSGFQRGGGGGGQEGHAGG